MVLDKGALGDRILQATEMLSCCEFCERRCRVDRRQGQEGVCGVGVASHVYRHYISYAEEIELLPSYMAYFSGCNFRCDSCIQAPQCLEAGGVPADAEFLRTMARNAAAQGAQTLNLVGGEPSLHVHTILEMAADAIPLPLVLNSNMYMTPMVLGWLDGIISLYLADFKFGNDNCASRIAGVGNYTAVVTRNLQQASSQGRLLVRHLLLPGHVECCLRPVATWMARNLPDVPLRVMYSYTQGWRSGESQLNRLVSGAEISAAGDIIKQSGVREYEPTAT
ncbi:MAG: 4Fe-4S cluster-binding domain-containing protein [Phycisphaerae bacterium]|jgi:putative pyruvate formate lyase activating enzyme